MIFLKLSQILGHKVMNLYQILSIYLIVNKSYGKTTEFHWNLELVVHTYWHTYIHANLYPCLFQPNITNTSPKTCSSDMLTGANFECLMGGCRTYGLWEMNNLYVQHPPIITSQEQLALMGLIYSVGDMGTQSIRQLPGPVVSTQLQDDPSQKCLGWVDVRHMGCYKWAAWVAHMSDIYPSIHQMIPVL